MAQAKTNKQIVADYRAKNPRATIDAIMAETKLSRDEVRQAMASLAFGDDPSGQAKQQTVKESFGGEKPKRLTWADAGEHPTSRPLGN